jgi:hypothetical protein
MKLRHAAALALVGWYLTVYVNPMGGCIGCEKRQTGPATIDVWGVYANASDCAVEQKKITTVFAENEKHPKTEYQVYRGTRCEASNDQVFKTKGSQLKFLSPSEKNDIIKTGIPD